MVTSLQTILSLITGEASWGGEWKKNEQHSQSQAHPVSSCAHAHNRACPWKERKKKRKFVGKIRSSLITFSVFALSPSPILLSPPHSMGTLHRTENKLDDANPKASRTLMNGNHSLSYLPLNSPYIIFLLLFAPRLIQQEMQFGKLFSSWLPPNTAGTNQY